MAARFLNRPIILLFAWIVFFDYLSFRGMFLTTVHFRRFNVFAGIHTR
jgi:hypothetical protein